MLPPRSHSIFWLHQGVNEGFNDRNIKTPQIAHKLNRAQLNSPDPIWPGVMDDRAYPQNTDVLEELLKTAIGNSNDLRSWQAKEALRSERFKSIEDMRSRIKNVGDMVRMGVPLPQAKAIWKVIHEGHKKTSSEKPPSAPNGPLSGPDKELQALVGVKLLASLYEW